MFAKYNSKMLEFSLIAIQFFSLFFFRISAGADKRRIRRKRKLKCNYRGSRNQRHKNDKKLKEVEKPEDERQVQIMKEREKKKIPTDEEGTGKHWKKFLPIHKVKYAGYLSELPEK